MDDSGFLRYRELFQGAPSEIVTWHDAETGATGWLAINSLRGGAAAGGTRMRTGATREEAVFLAKTMEVKFGVSGPPIGGAKSVLDFDPSDPRKREVLKRWFRHIGDHLKQHYGTGGDLNVPEGEVVELTREAIGLEDPQEGVIRGHLGADGEAFRRTLARLKEGIECAVRLPGIEPPLTMARLVTGFGVASSVEGYFDTTGSSVAGKRILVEGFGDVGAPAAYSLHRAGAKVVGIISRLSGRSTFRWWADPAGLDVEDLLARRVDTDLPAGGVDGEDPAPFWRTEADVFIPAAGSFLITEERLEELRHAGVSLISCGANNPFNDRELGEVTIQKRADRDFAIIPDFIANCGRVRTFAYLLQDGIEVSGPAILADIDRTVRDAVAKLLDGYTEKTGLLNLAYNRFLP